MKRILNIFIILFVLLTNQSIYSQSSEHFFNEGITFYQNGQYEQALHSFQKILDSGYENGSVYFNMGNCYYKLNNLGKAILFYERAVKLMPNDEDIQANLDLANKLVVDEIEPMEQFFIIQILNAYYYFLPLNLQLWLTAGAYIICGIFIGLWILTRKRRARIATFRLAVVFGIVCFVFGLSLLGRYSDQKNRVEAIILKEEVTVQSAPGIQEGSVEAFVIHEGTKVRIDREEGDWLEIVLLDGKVGWVEQSVLEVI